MSKPKVKVSMSDKVGALGTPGDPWAVWSDRQSRDNAVNEISDVYLMAVSHIAYYGAAISGACDTFKNYTETKIDDIDPDDVKQDIVKKVFSISLDLIKDMIPGAEGITELGKVVRDKIKDNIFELMGAPVAALSSEVDKKALKKLMRDLAQKGNALKRQWTTSHPGGQAGALQTVPILQNIANLVTSLQNNVKYGSPSDVKRDKNQEEFFETFYDTDVNERAALLYHFYAIPTPERADQAAWAFYKHLLHRFSKVYGWAASSRRDQIMHRDGHASRVQTNGVRFVSEGYSYWYSRP